MFIQMEDTPNPEALKFLPNQDISPHGPLYFHSKEEAYGKSLLAVKLFDIKDIKSVFLGANFITITKNQSDWSILKPEILMTIMDHLTQQLPAVDESPFKADILNQADLSDIERQIIEIIETRVRPSVAMDGGDITYRGFIDGIVKLELRGACKGCPSSAITLKNGIESMLQHFVPEVIAVEEVGADGIEVEHDENSTDFSR